MTDLKYKKAWQLREEILQAVGVDPKDRFGDGSQRGIRKANLLFIVAELKPDDENYDFADMKLTTIYSLLGEWAGVEHSPNSGIDWTMNRDLLKAIHRELDA